jgi:Ca-activated chloride channel family protein
MRYLTLCTISSLVGSILALLSLPTLLVAENQAKDPGQDQRERVIIVLDASGSMWGQIQKQPKISIAKDVVKDLISDWDPNTDLGLTVYGHRRKADCDDIESVIPVSPMNKSKVEGKLREISPKGKTPLSRAVIHAADELKYTEEKASVILVSDGIETCDLDPCEVAKQLEEKGVNFTAHVIGFDIKEEEAKKQLRCLAENTGGKFMSAKDAATLKSSLAEAVQEVALSKKNNVELVAVLTPGGEPLMNVYWEVADANNPTGQKVASGRGPTPKYTLEPGRYIASVRSQHGKATASKEFEVLPDQLAKEEVVLAEEGIVKLVAVNEPGGTPLSEVWWNVSTPGTEMQKGEDVAYGRGAQPEYTLLPGKYVAHVKSTKGKAEATQEIEVLAGKKTTIEVVMAQEGLIKLLAVNELGGTPLGDVYWQVETLPSGLEKKGESVAYGRGAQPEYKLLPGKYLAKVRSSKGKATASQEIEVIAGKKTTTEVVLAAEGIIKLVAVHTEGGEPLQEVYWTVETVVPSDSMEKPESVAYGRGAQPEYRLLPGRYMAKVKSQKGVAVASQEVEVIANKQRRIEVLFPEEGEIELSAVLADGKSPGRIYWEVLTLVNADLVPRQKSSVTCRGAALFRRRPKTPGGTTLLG